MNINIGMAHSFRNLLNKPVTKLKTELELVGEKKNIYIYKVPVLKNLTRLKGNASYFQFSDHNKSDVMRQHIFQCSMSGIDNRAL